MATPTFSLPTTDDHTVLHVHRWLPDGAPRAVVQVAHGMLEHAGRYGHLAERLTRAGYAVYASDHRGHGRTTTAAGVRAHLGDDHGFADAVDDLLVLTGHLRQQHPGTPVVLLGHSMGSMMARAYAARYGDRIDGLIVVGTASDPGHLGAFGVRLATLEARLRGARATSHLMQTLVLRPYNWAFFPNRTGSDWLSRDEAQVDAFLADDLCGGVATAGFYRDLLTGLRWVSEPSVIARVPRALPVHVVAGGADPVGGTAAVVQLASQLREHGVRDVTTRVWPGGRHEILNETNRDEVEQDLLAWLQERYGG